MAEYIERAAVVGKMTSGEVQKKLREMDGDQVYSYVLSLLNSEPAADVEHVKCGIWLPQIVFGQRAWDCSECKTLGSPHWKRCPVCEAKMEVDDG